MDIRFSVIMPTYNQCGFICRAIRSLLRQTYERWELIVIDDGSTDETETVVAEFLHDTRIRYVRLLENHGLGYAVNRGLQIARYGYVAYLPSDDFYYAGHLDAMASVFMENENAVLAFSGIRYGRCDSLHGDNDVESIGNRPGFWLQLVQVAHRRVDERWVERDEWVSEDLFSMYWQKLLSYGTFLPTCKITAFWTQHPAQRFRIISETYGGGINKVRSFYHIKNPIRIRVSKDKFIDERGQYKAFRAVCHPCGSPLKILVVGELAYNPERLYALEQAGHKLYGLWTPSPNLSFSTVGPLPFGNVEDIPHDNWEEAVASIRPDIVYGLLNWGAIGWVYDVVRRLPDIPFAWHYKEGPQLAVSMGNWQELAWLYRHASLRIFLNDTVRQWFELFLPSKPVLTMIMDGDMPKKDYFKDTFSPKLSESDGEVHTVCAGRLIGIRETSVKALVRNRIHLHLYLENFFAAKEKLFAYFAEAYSGYFHIHSHCSPDRWTEEFSKYDAAWLHCIRSANYGDLYDASWDDLNIPARLSTYMAAALPVIQYDNTGHIVAVERCVRNLGIGMQFHDIDHLSDMLHDKVLMAGLQANVMRHRMSFCFDRHVPELIDKFRIAIKERQS